MFIYKRSTIFAVLVALLSAFIMGYYGITSEGAISANEITKENYLMIANSITAEFGLDALSLEDILPEYLESFPTTEEWKAYLLDELSKMSALMESKASFDSIGYEPSHDSTVILFSGNEAIRVYIDSEPIETDERAPYAVRHGNYDAVMLPMEIIFDRIGITYAFDEESNLLHIFGLADDVILEPERRGLSRNVVEFPWDDELDDSEIVYLSQKDESFYINTEILPQLLGEMQLLGSPDIPIFYSILTPLIYHDLNKVVLVTNDYLSAPNYANKNAEMNRHFVRANHPLEGQIKLMVNLSSPNSDYTELTFDEAKPFVVSTKNDDYIMLPLVEVCDYLEIETVLDININAMKVYASNNIYEITEGSIIYASDIEAAAVSINNILFVSHTDILGMMRDNGFNGFLSYHQSCLYIIKQLPAKAGRIVDG